MRLVIFDLDGTLIDFAQFNVRTIAAALGEAGLPVPADKVIRSISGITFREAMKILAPDASEAQLTAVVEAYRSRHRASEGLQEVLFDGAIEALDRLQADPETILAVATGKGYAGAVTLLERRGIIGRFHSLQTPDHNRGKPDPQMIETAVAKAGADKAQTVMIGDTVHDMRMAKAAGVHAIGVGWGYHEAVELREAGADIVIEQFSELDDAIERLTGADDA